MKRTALPVTVVLCALCGATLLGCSGDPASASSDTFPAAALTTLASASGALSLEVRTAPTQPLTRGIDAIEYTITDKDGAPAEGLALTVLPWMPEMGHGASVTPQVTDTGGGKYLVSDVELFMAGEWQLRTTIGPDSATPVFQIP